MDAGIWASVNSMTVFRENDLQEGKGTPVCAAPALVKPIAVNAIPVRKKRAVTPVDVVAVCDLVMSKALTH